MKRYSLKETQGKVSPPFPNRHGIRVLAFVALFCLSAPMSSLASEGAKAAESAAPPALILPLVKPLPPIVSKAAATEANPAWVRYQEGRRLYDERRFGEALMAFKYAAQQRRELFLQASARIDAAFAAPESAFRKASVTNDSIRELIAILVMRDLIARDFGEIRKEAGNSLPKLIDLLEERRLSDLLSGFLDAARLILEHRNPALIGDSLAKLRTAAGELANFPEAEFWIGKIYLAEGETRLAELQLTRSLDMREALEVPEDRYSILDALASIYKNQGKTRDFEQKLREIADDSVLFSKKDEFLRLAMERSLVRNGIDKFMLLYRIEEPLARKAYGELGSLYLESGRPLAVIYLAAAVNVGLTRVINAIKKDDPGYIYTDLENLLARMSADRNILRYSLESGICRDMLLLGEALSAEGSRDSAYGIWRPMAATKNIEPWNRKAAEALARPRGLRPFAPVAKP